MYHWADHGRCKSRPRRDAGFSLIEIIVALGIFSLVLVALLPQLVTGIRATGVARIVSQAKGISQGQLEQMRHLPFHIAPSAGDFVDVLDYYYPDLVAPTAAATCLAGGKYTLPTTGWSGYVAADAGPRCDYEPASGAFYRKVKIVPAAPGITAFTVVVDTQFLSGATPPTPVSPLAGYHTRTVGKDSPASSQIGVTVTVLYDRRGTLRPASAYSQIAERLTSATLVRSEADVRVLDLGTATAAQVPLTFSAGLLNLTGSVSYVSTVNANLAATSAGLATGEQEAGASTTLSAPSADPPVATAAPAGSLSTSGCHLACWDSTSAPSFGLSADEGLPRAGSALAPVQVLMGEAPTTHDVFWFGASATDDYRAVLQLVPPLARIGTAAGRQLNGISTTCTVAESGTPAWVSATGYLTTTDEAHGETVESCATARATRLELFATDFAPNGVVQVELTRASARCLVSGSAHAAITNYDYAAVVRYFNGGGYTDAATVQRGQTVDPLAAIDPTTITIYGARKLSDYVGSWSTLTLDEIVDSQQGGVAQVNLPGLVRIASQPVRPNAAGDAPDDLSVVSVKVGALSCRAEDQR